MLGHFLAECIVLLMQGDSWDETNTGLADRGIRALVCTPKDFCYAGTVESGVFRSIQSTNSPEVSTIPNQVLCAGSAVQMNSTVENGVAPFTYQWMPSDGLDDPTIKDPLANPSATTTYTLQVQDANELSASTTVTLTVVPLPTVEVSENQSICAGESVQLQASGGVTYSWEPSTGLDDPSKADPQANPSETTIYTVTVTDDNGCWATATTQVEILPSPDLVVSDDIAICSGGSAALQASGAEQYTWAPATGLSDPNSATPTASPATTTEYTCYSTHRKL